MCVCACMQMCVQIRGQLCDSCLPFVEKGILVLYLKLRLVST